MQEEQIDLPFQLKFNETKMTENESMEMENSNISVNNRNLRNEKFYLVPICIGACFVIALAIAIIILLLTAKIYHDNIEKG